MILELVRQYSSSAGRNVARGCRILDYASPKTHTVVPRASWLLSARSGARYENRDPNYDESPELATIASFLFKTSAPGINAPPQWPQLRDRLGLDPGLSFDAARKRAESHGLPVIEQIGRDRIEAWVDCVRADSLEAAIEIISTRIDDQWPDFVVLYTFGRRSISPLEAYNAIRVFQTLVPRVSPHILPELGALAIRIAQDSLIDLVPVVARVVVDVLGNIDAASLNELLWQIARYGKRWSLVDVPILSEAQEVLVRAAGPDLIDLKGMFALCYVAHFKSPELARRAMCDLAPVGVQRTPKASEHEFAYSNGVLVIKLLTSETADEALAVVDEATHHLPAMWTCAALFLSRRGLLSESVATNLWSRAMSSSGTRITALLAELVLGSIPDSYSKKKILYGALSRGLKLTAGLVASLAKVKTESELQSFRTEYTEWLDNPRVLEQVLASASIVQPWVAWDDYNRLTSSGARPPSRRALRAICRAAWDSNLVWDGLYSSQRALAEVRQHIRGAAAPSDDLLRMYPDDALLYTYIVMLGRAGYGDELLGFLEWMEQLNCQPPKRVLLALVHYSPQGPALIRLGQKTRPPQSEWPSEDEYAAYAKMLDTSAD